MPIRIPANLPAATVLAREGVMVMAEDDADRQDIRPLRVGLLNLMPDKIRTEAQIARLVGASPLQVELDLLRMATHNPKTVSPEHMLSFYRPWDEVRGEKFDGLIVTGAPIELMDFEQVNYWPELTALFDWADTHVHSLFSICWGAQAALYHYHGVPKRRLDAKAFGVFRHRNLSPSSPYLRGFSDDFSIPVSRWTEVRRADLPEDRGIEVLMEGSDTGLCMLVEAAKRRLYMFNHVEYDSTSLAEEYNRDVAKGSPIAVPKNYFPADDPQYPPENRWRSHAHLLFGNWLNEVYQSTPFSVDEIGG